MTVILVILILVVLIIVHELGHFVAAKISKVRVQEFGIGYPPVALSMGRIGETEYTLNWIPFGGFVRLFGDAGENERGPGSFMSANRGKQAFILAAGVFMNLLTGWALFTAAYMIGIPRPVEADTTASAASIEGSHLFIADVVPGSPAEAAGIKPGDEVLSMTDQNGGKLEHLSPEGVRSFVEVRGGKKIDVVYLRPDSSGVKATSSTGVIPANAVIPTAPDRAGVGLDLVLITSEPLDFFASGTAAFNTSKNAFVGVAVSVWHILKNAVLGSVDLRGMVGPVGLVTVVADASHAGIAQVLALAAFISINLAVINLVPIPMLDGGRLVVVGFEAMFRRRAPKIAIHVLNTVGVVSILALMIVVTYHDIARLVA